MAKACEECSFFCNMMHKNTKNPAPLVTTFVKVMMGDNFSKTLFLPPSFASRVKKWVGERTDLEDLNGEKWNVNITMIDERLAFEDGWDIFAVKHGLQKGDILVFHYIRNHHFVVMMYGSTGCPELRHFGFPNNNLTVNGQSKSKVNTNCNNTSHESSSKSASIVHGVNDMQTNQNTTNTQHLIDKETDQRSEPLVENTFTDCKLTKSPTTVKPLCSVDNNNRYEQDESRRNSLQPLVVESGGAQKNSVVASDAGSHETEINRIQNLVESDGGLNNKNVATSGGDSDEAENYRIRKSVGPDGGQKNNVDASGGGPDKIKFSVDLERRIAMSHAKRKANIVNQSEVAHDISTHKRPRPADGAISPAKTPKREPTTTAISPKSMAKPMESIQNEPTTNHVSGGLIKKELTMNHGLDGLMKNEPTMNHGSGGLVKKELTMNHGLDGSMKDIPTMNHGSSDQIKREPKPEPVDYDESPVSGPSNPSFSATMTSYKYLELPGSVKVKSKTILLRNGTDLWPVLYQSKFGIKALTQSWSLFAEAKGIKPGDKCEFVLERESHSVFSCSVYDVHVTR